MRTLKIFPTQVDLIDMGELLNGDPDGTLLRHLQVRLKNKCDRKCLVLDVLRIEKQSDIRINAMSGTGQGYANVSYVADVIEYVPGEGVVAEIRDIDDKTNYIHLEREEHMAANMRRIGGIKVAKVDQMIPIRILRASYEKGKSMISVSAQLYLLPQDDSYIFEIEPLTKEEKEELEPKLKEISELEKTLKKSDKKALKFFTDLLYPFSNKKKIEGTAIDMRKLSASGFVTRNSRTEKSEPTIHVIKKNKKSMELVSKKEPSILVYQSFLNDYALHMHILIDLLEKFKDPSTRKSHSNIWKIYKAYKKP